MVNKIKIKKEYCKGCGFCVEICPKTVLKQNNKANSRGYIVAEVVKPEDCIACKKCELICPEMAITVVKDKEEDA
jgi:2-oxoglutarate ferredoxin oxidoreductase subunit delta